MIKRMGAKEWNTLHNLIYPIAALALLHYYMQSKVDVTQPVLMSGFFFWLMGYRLMARYGYKEGLVPLLVLSRRAALLTALAEATWYGLATGIGFRRVILANLDFCGQIRPAWWVLAAGLAVTAVAEIRRRHERLAAPRARRGNRLTLPRFARTRDPSGVGSSEEDKAMKKIAAIMVIGVALSGCSHFQTGTPA